MTRTISHNFVGIMDAKHGPAVSVIPDFIPLNPYLSILFVLYQLSFKKLRFAMSIKLNI